MATKTIEVSDLNLAIEERVRELGLTKNKAEAAREIGVSRQVYEGWLRGRAPRLDGPTQTKLAVFLHVPPAKILTLAGYDLSGKLLRVVDTGVTTAAGNVP